MGQTFPPVYTTCLWWRRPAESAPWRTRPDASHPAAPSLPGTLHRISGGPPERQISSVRSFMKKHVQTHSLSRLYGTTALWPLKVHLLCSSGVDERPLGGVGLRAVTQPELRIHGSAQLLHEAIVDPALNQEPVWTHTRLQEGGEDRTVVQSNASGLDIYM